MTSRDDDLDHDLGDDLGDDADPGGSLFQNALVQLALMMVGALALIILLVVLVL